MNGPRLARIRPQKLTVACAVNAARRCDVCLLAP